MLLNLLSPPACAPPSLFLSPCLAGGWVRARVQVVEEGMGDLDIGAVYRYVYGSGSQDHSEWKEGEQLWSSQAS